MRLLIIFFICVVYSQNQNLEDFGENLYIKPLTDGKYLFHFEFSSNYNDTNCKFQILIFRSFIQAQF